MQAQVLPIVLIVEDEPLLRLMAISTAEDAGFDTLDASNADEALKILEGRSDIRVIFTDVDMPGSMDGLGLVRLVNGRWPLIGIIVTSGHYQISASQLPIHGYFFGKPYDGKQIAEALRALAA